MSKNIFVFLGDTIEGAVDITRYPDGQRNVCLRLDELDKKHSVKIHARVRFFHDLELLSCLIAALKRNDFYIDILNFHYLFGIRSDRSFNNGEPNYFKDVVSPVINSWELHEIFLYWPFDPLPVQFNYVSNMSVHSGLHFTPVNAVNCNKMIGGDSSVVSFGRRTVIMNFNKLRNDNGRIVISLGDPIPEDHAIIVDDLCDGGGTFIAAAEWLVKKKIRPKVLELFVYHGLFTKGIDVVAEHFDHIYCTNSYQDLEHPKLTQYKVI